MEALAERTLPEGFSYEWTELAYQQQQAGNTAAFVFAFAVLVVFLVLAGQYESVTLPLAVVLIVPMCLLAAITGVLLRGQDNNILTQIGLVVLVGLACKNAILIVEFAKQAEEQLGLNRFEAAAHAARVRLRPILMTSFAFILGVVPLVVARAPAPRHARRSGPPSSPGCSVSRSSVCCSHPCSMSSAGALHSSDGSRKAARRRDADAPSPVMPPSGGELHP